MAYDFKGKTALVTGASSGIGSCIARQLASRGARPVLVARGVPKLEALAAELKAAYGVDCPVIRADLSLPGEAAKLHEECMKRGINVDILVNNAGIGLFGSALEQEPAVVESMLRLNVLSLVELCQLFGRDMAGRGNGRILNVASMVALMPTPYFSNYAASKAYVRSFTSSLRAELRSSGVRASALFPGYVKTNFDAASQVTNRNYAEMSAKMGMKPDKVAAVGIRLIRSGRPSSVAGITNKIGAFFINGIPKAFLARVSYGYLKSIIGKDE